MKSVTAQLYDRYLRSQLVQQTEDVLTQADIHILVNEMEVTKENWNADENKEMRRYFWDIVRERHYDAL